MPSPERTVFTVSQLNREVRAVLEGGFPLIWVEGEISNLARPASGHLYFSLKDDAAQVRCAMWRNRNQLLRFKPADGQRVLARARISLYEPRGEYQLQIESLEEAGFGALQRAFEALKARLQAEGLFDAARKKPLPALPRRIGVITSLSGAALHDILSTLTRRWPSVEVILYPVPVQGAGAAEQIAAALALANRRGECDLVIAGRGGGSLEDLWAFNEEIVARAIATSAIPVISAVGHEVDVTIADFVADARAPTPTGAAEMAVPEQAEWLRGLDAQARRLTLALQARLRQGAAQLDALHRHLRLAHPGARLTQHSQRLDELEQRLRGGWQRQLQTHQTRLTGLARALQAVSPLATLGRGYAIVRGAGGRVLRAATDTAPGDTIEAQLSQGRLRATVVKTEK